MSSLFYAGTKGYHDMMLVLAKYMDDDIISDDMTQLYPHYMMREIISRNFPGIWNVSRKKMTNPKMQKYLKMSVSDLLKNVIKRKRRDTEFVEGIQSLLTARSSVMFLIKNGMVDVCHVMLDEDMRFIPSIHDAMFACNDYELIKEVISRETYDFDKMMYKNDSFFFHIEDNYFDEIKLPMPPMFEVIANVERFNPTYCDGKLFKMMCTKPCDDKTKIFDILVKHPKFRYENVSNVLYYVIRMLENMTLESEPTMRYNNIIETLATDERFLTLYPEIKDYLIFYNKNRSVVRPFEWHEPNPDDNDPRYDENTYSGTDPIDRKTMIEEFRKAMMRMDETIVGDNDTIDTRDIITRCNEAIESLTNKESKNESKNFSLLDDVEYSDPDSEPDDD